MVKFDPSVGLRSVESLAPTDPASLSKQNKWLWWLDYFNRSREEIAVSTLVAFGLYLLDSGISSAKLYVSAAHTFEKGRIPSRLSWAVTRDSMVLVYAKLDEANDHAAEKAAPITSISEVAGPRPSLHLLEALQIVLFACSLGIRPIALESLDKMATPIRMVPPAPSPDPFWNIAFRFLVHKDKVKMVERREVHYFCTCESAPHLCLIHSLGFPKLPLTRARLNSALGRFGDINKNYASRRAHVMAVSTLLVQEYRSDTGAHTRKRGRAKSNKTLVCDFVADEDARHRMNSQLNWVPDSTTFLKYSAGFDSETVKFSSPELDLYRAIFRYYRHGVWPYGAQDAATFQG
eukprot:g4798.t1